MVSADHGSIGGLSQNTGNLPEAQGCYNVIVRLSELPNELSERGIWWQVAGFSVVALASLAILAEFAGSETRAFRYVEIATTKLYWAFLVPLGGLFEGARKMFEKASEIRAAQRAKMQERWTSKGRKEGREEGRKETVSRMQEAYERFGVDQNGVTVLPRTPEVERFLFGQPEESSSS